jgi:hypothetical protein
LYISDSKQPSISNFGASDNRSILCDSRRQSNAQRNDFDGAYSLQGSYRESSSPFISRLRKFDQTPLFINNNDSESHAINDTCEDLRKEGINGSTEDASKRQIARVRPQYIAKSTNSSSDEISKFCRKCIFFNSIMCLSFSFFHAGSFRHREMNEDYANFQKSYSLDPFPVPECQVKKRVTAEYRKRQNAEQEEPLEPTIVDCNGGITSRIQRSDHIPLLINTKRWHSLELKPVGSDDGEHGEESSGCDELIASKKSLKNRLGFKKPSWFGRFRVGSGNKNAAQNGSGLLQQQSSAITTSMSDKESIV